jgi:hypothetical protein
MTENDIFNFVLPLDESSKRDSASVGWNGVGFLSALRDRAGLKSSDGKGMTWYLRFTPIVRDTVVVDHNVEIWSEREAWRGTVVTAHRPSNNPATDAIVARGSLTKLVALVDANRMSVIANGEPVNTVLNCVYSENIEGYGDLRVYQHWSNSLTQLFKVANLDSRDIGRLPSFLQHVLLKNIGMVVDVPRKYQLTTARTDIASRELLPEQHYDAVYRGAMHLLIHSVSDLRTKAEQWFPYETLPKNYFLMQPFPSDLRITEDALRIAGGVEPKYLDLYRTDDKLLLLLAELPLFVIDNEAISLTQIQKLYYFEKLSYEKWQNLPVPLRRMIIDANNHKNLEKNLLSLIGSGRGVAEYDTVKLNPFVWCGPPPTANANLNQWLKNHRDAIELLDCLNRLVLNELAQGILPADVSVTPVMYYDGYESANSWRSQKYIGWNLKAMYKDDSTSALRMLARDILHVNNNEKCLETFRVIVEQCAHMLESTEDFTFNTIFERRVVDLMAVLVARGSYDRFCEVLATVDANEGLDNIKRLFVPKLE